MSCPWPDKSSREEFEIGGFIRFYATLPHGLNFKMLKRSEKPDYLLQDIASNDVFGVELTSVYLDDRSVPDVHMNEATEVLFIADDPQDIKNYQERILQSSLGKIHAARSGYDLSSPLILSMYLNEYISIYFNVSDMESLVARNGNIFAHMMPFSEIVFWPLPNEDVFSVSIWEEQIQTSARFS